MAGYTVDSVKAWIGENHKPLGIAIGGIIVIWKVGTKLKEHLENLQRQPNLKKWDNSPKDVVILHTLPRGKTVPNLSPFAMKLETFLRMAKIPYEIDFESAWGPVGKTPWITLNGEHIVDSKIIIGHLQKKYDIVIGNYSEQEVAVGKTVGIMMDEYLYWGLGLWRYVYSEGKGLDEIFDMPPSVLKQFQKGVHKRVMDYAWAQGVGRHSKEQVIGMMNEVLKNASLILGNKKFLLGEQPSQEDCPFFGFLSMVMWAAPGSPYEKYLKEELPNLESYCHRMKDRFWGDWEQCLAGAN